MNSDLKITFLGSGTSQGVPIIGSTHPVCLSTDSRDKRLRVSVLIQWLNKSIVIDCGPDFRQQLLRVNATALDAILITHEHSDHTAGLDDIRPFCFMRGGPFPFYATPKVFGELRKRFGYIFETENKYPGAPSIETNEISKDSPFLVEGKNVIPVEGFHYKLPVLGFRIDGFTYLTDIKTMAETEILKIKNTDVLVVNCLREDAHPSHFNLTEALEFIEKVNPKKAYKPFIRLSRSSRKKSSRERAFGV
jgi:phosphoribosyl 1,2-cyclic phosphate phosphodiesterase